MSFNLGNFAGQLRCDVCGPDAPPIPDPTPEYDDDSGPGDHFFDEPPEPVEDPNPYSDLPELPERPDWYLEPYYEGGVAGVRGGGTF